MRIITLDTNKTVISYKTVNDEYINNPGLQPNEIQSDIGEYGQIQQTDGSFITPVPPTPTLQDIKATKIQEVTTAYQQDAYNTFTSAAYDGTTVETYSCTANDQVRLNGVVTIAMAVKSGFSTESVSWHNINQPVCVAWQPQNIINLGSDLHKFQAQKQDYFEALVAYINSLLTTDDVNKVTYGMTIPTTS